MLNWRQDATALNPVRTTEWSRGPAVRGVEAELAGVLRSMLDQKDPYTTAHMSRVAWLSVRIGERLGMENGRLEGLHLGALLHDLGKFSVPTDILAKPGRLSPGELELVREHPRRGYEIVSKFSWRWPVPEMVLQHHERIDGSGYPFGLARQDILTESRIIAIADVVEAIVSHRPYRGALPRQVAIDELERWRGTRYDASAVDACLEILEDVQFRILPDPADRLCPTNRREGE